MYVSLPKAICVARVVCLYKVIQDHVLARMIFFNHPNHALARMIFAFLVRWHIGPGTLALAQKSALLRVNAEGGKGMSCAYIYILYMLTRAHKMILGNICG